MNGNTDAGNGMQGRRSASRAAKLRRRRQRFNFLLVIGFIAVIVLIVLLTPKQPLTRALYSIGTDDGTVEEGGVRLVSAYEGVRISEVMSANSSAVTDENGDYSDWVEIWNTKDEPVSLKGLGLSDRNDSIRFLFPDETLEEIFLRLEREARS